jgi:predicted DsbA family dithiol-disulfide isomerase
MERMAGELEEIGIDLDWSPIDLVRITGRARGAVVEGPRRDNALHVAQDLGVSLKMPALWIDSREVNAVALALAGTDREPTWRECVFSAIYEEGRSPDRADFLDSLDRELDLDARALCTPEKLTALDDATRKAHRSEVTGVPTFMLDRWPFGGIQEIATMRSFLGRWAAKKRKALEVDAAEPRKRTVPCQSAR